MRKRGISVIVLVFIILMVGIGYVGYKVYNKYNNLVTELRILTSSSQMLLANHNNTPLLHNLCQSKRLSDTLKVVCLGNSITKHPYKPDVEWYADWGMAASKEKYDYCHVLERKLREFNSNSSVIPYNVSTFEHNPTCNLDSLLLDICNDADIIVIRLGENVRDVKLFEDNIQSLIDKCKSYTQDIIITGNFWMNAKKENVLLNAAYNNDLIFVPLSWIVQLQDVYPKKGDTIYNNNGVPYKLKNDFILTHPNDKGMEIIAEVIFNAITKIYTY